MNKCDCVRLRNRKRLTENIQNVFMRLFQCKTHSTCIDESTSPTWNQKMAAVERLPVFGDGENDSVEDDFHSFVDKTSHLATAVLRRCVEMNILEQPYLHRPP